LVLNHSSAAYTAELFLFTILINIPKQFSQKINERNEIGKKKFQLFVHMPPRKGQNIFKTFKFSLKWPKYLKSSQIDKVFNIGIK